MATAVVGQRHGRPTPVLHHPSLRAGDRRGPRTDSAPHSTDGGDRDTCGRSAGDRPADTKRDISILPICNPAVAPPEVLPGPVSVTTSRNGPAEVTTERVLRRGRPALASRRAELFPHDGRYWRASNHQAPPASAGAFSSESLSLKACGPDAAARSRDRSGAA